MSDAEWARAGPFGHPSACAGGLSFQHCQVLGDCSVTELFVLIHELKHTEEEKLSGLFPQTKVVENARKPVPDEHLGCKIMIF